jgi:hypothetical protein
LPRRDTDRIGRIPSVEEELGQQRGNSVEMLAASNRSSGTRAHLVSDRRKLILRLLGAPVCSDGILEVLASDRHGTS